MKIGIVTEYFYPTLGGITENIYHFSRELLRRGHDFRIITGNAGDPKNIEKDIKDRIIRIGLSTPMFSNGSCGRITLGTGITKKIKNVLSLEKFDLLHLHSPLFPTLPLVANMCANVPMVGTLHTCMGTGTFFDKYYKLYHGRCSAMLDRMAGRIAVSECCARENGHHFKHKFDVIPNGVDVEWWAKDVKSMKKFKDGLFNILFLGRPDTRNGLDTLIHAFIHVHKKYPNTRLIIVGDGPLRFYFERLVPHNLKKFVVFEGPSLNERPQYLASADVFCFTPTIASFGITILEGMSAGRAIIASDIEAFRALVTHGESALLVPPADESALAAAIERLINDDNLRASLGATAAMRVERYDWKRIAQMQIEYYHRILTMK